MIQGLTAARTVDKELRGEGGGPAKVVPILAYSAAPVLNLRFL